MAGVVLRSSVWCNSQGQTHVGLDVAPQSKSRARSDAYLRLQA